MAAVSNIGPLIIAVMSYFIFGKGLSPLDTSVLIISFVGVTFLITGSVNNNNQTKKNDEGVSLVGPIIAMLTIPILAGTLAMT